LGLEPDEAGQKGLKLPHLWCHKKSEIKNQKIFFVTYLKTCRVCWGFEHLSSTIGVGAMDLQRHMQTAWFMCELLHLTQWQKC